MQYFGCSSMIKSRRLRRLIGKLSDFNLVYC